MEHLQECWDASITDTKRGFARGPFYSVPEVTEEEWIAMPRFPVPQKSSVRPVDDGSSSGSRANLFAALCERFEVNSIDHIISPFRLLC